MNNTSSAELGTVMQAVLGALSAHDFINYLTVSTGRAISEYDKKIEEERED